MTFWAKVKHACPCCCGGPHADHYEGWLARERLRQYNASEARRDALQRENYALEMRLQQAIGILDSYQSFTGDEMMMAGRAASIAMSGRRASTARSMQVDELTVAPRLGSFSFRDAPPSAGGRPPPVNPAPPRSASDGPTRDMQAYVRSQATAAQLAAAPTYTSAAPSDPQPSQPPPPTAPPPVSPAPEPVLEAAPEPAAPPPVASAPMRSAFAEAAQRPPSPEPERPNPMSRYSHGYKPRVPPVRVTADAPGAPALTQTGSTAAVQPPKRAKPVAPGQAGGKTLKSKLSAGPKLPATEVARP